MPHTTTKLPGIDARYFSERMQRVLAGIHRYTPAELARELTRMAMLAEPEIAAKEMEESRCAADTVAADVLPAGAPTMEDRAAPESTGANDQPDTGALREAVLLGLVKMGHRIDDDCVTIHRTKADAGNALYQVTESIVTAVKAVVDTFAAVPAAAPEIKP